MLTKGFVKKKYNKMLIASILGWIVALVGSLADSVIAGIFISEDAVSATGLVSPVFSLSFFLSTLVGVGAAAVYSYTAGAFEVEKAKRVNGTSLVFAIICGFVMAALFYFGEDAYFTFYSSSPGIEAMARDYYQWYIVIGLLYPIYWLVYSWVSVDGDSTLVLCTDIFTAVANAGFSVLFVQIIGVAGLALGTLVSTVLSTLILLAHFFRKSNSIRIKLCLNIKTIGEISLAGSSAAMCTLYVGIIDIVMNKFIIVYIGEAFLAAYAIVNLMLNLAQICQCAVDAAGPFIGTSYGEGNPVALRKTMKMCTKQSLVVGLVMTIVFLVLAPWVPMIYGIVTPEIYAASVFSVRVLALSYIITSMIYVWGSYFPRIERPFLGNMISIIYSLITPLVPVIPMAMKWGYTGLVWGFFINPFLSFVIMTIVIIARNGVKAWPFAIDDSENKIFTHEYALNDDDVLLLRDTVGEELAGAGVAGGIIMKVQLMIEELCATIKKQNELEAESHGKKMKKILGDCTVMVSDKDVQLIMRDNGKLFDITNCDADITSLSQYVANRLMEDGSENTYMTTVSFNRSCYKWEM